MREKWLMVCVLAMTWPAVAQEPPVATQAPSENLPRAKAWLDGAAAKLEAVLVELEAPNLDSARRRDLMAKYSATAAALRPEGEARRSGLTQAERAAMDDYSREKAWPLQKRMVAAMAKAQPPEPPPHPLTDDLIDGKIAVWSATRRTVAFCDHWHEEGMGEGAQVIFHRGGPSGDTVRLYEPSDDEPSAELQRNRPAVLQRLVDGQYVALPPLAWNGKRPLALPGSDWKLTWQKRRLFGQRRGQKRVELAHIASDAVWKVAPMAVFAAPGVPVLVVAIDHDPGELYNQGLNQVTAHEPVWLPETPTPSKK